MVQVPHGRELDHVEADDLARGGDVVDQPERLAPAEAAGHGRAGGGDHGGIEGVEVEGNEDFFGEIPGDPFFRQLAGGEEPRVVGADRLFVFGAVVRFFAADGAGADLDERETEFVHAPQDAGVGELRALVDVAQVGVGVEMDDADFFAGGLEGARGTQRGGVFAAEHGRQRAAAQGLGHGLFDTAQPALGQAAFAGGGLDKRLGVDGQIGRPAAAIEVVELARGFQDRARRAGRAAAVADGGFHRRGNHVHLRLLRGRVCVEDVEEGRNLRHGEPHVSK